MGLWDLMTALCFVMPIAGALATVKDVHKGWIGYALAILVGVVVGAFCAWAMRTIGSKVAGDSKPGTEAQKPWLLRMLYAATVIWIVFALFLGSWLTEASLRFI
jgi:hypothetical protein